MAGYNNSTSTAYVIRPTTFGWRWTTTTNYKRPHRLPLFGRSLTYLVSRRRERCHIRALATLVANSIPPSNPVTGKTWCLNKGHVHLCTIFSDIVHPLLPWSYSWTLSMYVPMERDVLISAWCHSDYMSKVGKSPYCGPLNIIMHTSPREGIKQRCCWRLSECLSRKLGLSRQPWNIRRLKLAYM